MRPPAPLLALLLAAAQFLGGPAPAAVGPAPAAVGNAPAAVGPGPAAVGPAPAAVGPAPAAVGNAPAARSAAPAAQAPPAAPDSATLGELLHRARDPRQDPEARLEAMEALLAAGTQGAAILAPQLEREAARVRREYERARTRFLRAFERAARRLAATRQGRAAELEIADLRAAILDAMRAPGFTRETIVAVSSPALAKLEELLLVKPDQVYDLEPERFDELGALLDSLEEQANLHGLWTRARQDLVDGGFTHRARTLTEPYDPSGEEEHLLREVELLSLLATPMASRDADTLRANRLLGQDAALGLDPEELAGIERLNVVRILCGLPALTLDPRLCDASRDHSKDMVELGFFSHTSPVPGKETVGRRAANFNTTARAENIAAGQSTGAGAIEAWWHSPGHHRNQLGNHTRIGLGRWERTWTQKLG